MEKQAIQGALRALTFMGKSLYWVLFSMLGVFCLFLLYDVFVIASASPHEIKQYPFGTEQGVKYLSKESYAAFASKDALILFLSLLCSLSFYRQGRLLLGLIVITAPLFVGYMTNCLTEMMYTNP